MSDLLKRALGVPFTFDMLRDPNWQPTREDYRSLCDGAEAALADVREANQTLREVIRLVLNEADNHTLTWLAYERLSRALAAHADTEEHDENCWIACPHETPPA